MLLIYLKKETNRIKYTFDLIFRQLIGIDYIITHDIDFFKLYQDPKINYSERKIENEIFFYSTNLLFETGIKDQEFDVGIYNEINTIFFHYKNADLPFDPFAASFYLITRYEEYLPFIKDKFGRFSADQSIAFKLGFLRKPMINIWSEKIAELLKNKFPQITFPKKTYKYISTIDIDNAFAYKYKGLIRNIGGFFKSFRDLEFGEVAERAKVLLRLKKDPFDTYDLQMEIQKKYNIKPIYFFLFADYGVNDKNIHVENSKYHALIKSIGDYSEVGIHPSWGSNFSTEKLRTEIRRLSNVLNREIEKSRQHFLKISLPFTYRNLLAEDILEDYTMGYASEIGFRASICSTFFFYDLDREKESKLKIFPFAVMDGTLKDYQNLSSFEALSYIKPLIDEVRAVNGTFITLWHNESLCNMKRWTGWAKVYEEMVSIAV